MKWDELGFCTECAYYFEGVCTKTKHEPRAVCPAFAITDEATAQRYANARRTSRRSGIGYDPDLAVFRAYPEHIQRMIREKLGGVVID